MFGRFTCQCSQAAKEFAISIERDGKFLRYRGDYNNERVERINASAGHVVFFHQVEQVSLLKEVHRYLEIFFPQRLVWISRETNDGDGQNGLSEAAEPGGESREL